ELQRAMLVRSFADNFSKSGIASTDMEAFLTLYAGFLALSDSIAKQLAQFGNALDFIYAARKFDNKLEPTAEPDSKFNYYNRYVGKSFSAKGDLVQIKLNLLNRVNGDTAITQTFSYFTYGKMRFDFSTGFYYCPLLSESYSKVGYNGDSTQVYFSKDNTKKGD